MGELLSVTSSSDIFSDNVEGDLVFPADRK